MMTHIVKFIQILLNIWSRMQSKFKMKKALGGYANTARWLL